MAKRRINKTLVTLLIVIGVVLLGAMGVLWWKYRDRDPMPFLDEARTLVAQANEQEAENQQKADAIADRAQAVKQLVEWNKDTVDLKRSDAVKAFGAAFRYSSKNHLLQQQVAMELSELYLQMKKYRDAIGVWMKLVEMDANDFEARRRIRDYFYQASQNNANQWLQVKQQAEELIAVAKSSQQDQAEEDLTCGGRLTANDYLVQAHAVLAMLLSGSEMDIDNSIKTAQELIDKALHLDEKNLMAEYLFAQMEVIRQLHASLEDEKAQHQVNAESWFRRAIEDHPEDPQAYEYYVHGVLLNKLNKIYSIYNQMISLGTTEYQQTGQLAENTDKGLKVVEEEYKSEVEKALKEIDSMIERFPNDGRFYTFKADILSKIKTTKYEELIALYQKAINCPSSRTLWYLSLGNIYSLQIEKTNSRETLPEAFQFIKKAFSDPRLKEISGPEELVRRQVRYQLNMLMVDITARLYKASQTDEEKAVYMKNVRQISQEIQDLTGEQSIPSKIARGTLAQVEGNSEDAIKQLFEADRQVRVEGRSVIPQLKRQLFYLLRDAGYDTVAIQYGLDVIPTNHISEELMMDMLNLLRKIPSRQVQRIILQVVSQFERLFPDSPRQQEITIIQAMANIKLGQFEEAQKVLEHVQGDSDQVQLLRAQAYSDSKTRFEKLAVYQKDHPDDPALANLLFEYYLREGKNDPTYYDRARTIAQTAYKAHPDDLALQRMLAIANEPDPSNIPEERLRAILLEQAQNIKDPFDQNTALGQYYFSLVDTLNVGQWSQQELQDLQKAKEYLTQAYQLQPENKDAFIRLFNVVLNQQDWAEGDRLVKQWMKVNPIQSYAFDADMKASHGNDMERQNHLDQAKQYWQEASDLLTKFLIERPVQVSAYITLAKLNMKLDQPRQALENAQTAFSIDRSNLNVLLVLAGIKHSQNMKTGLDNMPQEEVTRMVGLVGRILDLDQTNIQAHQLSIVYNPMWMAAILDSVHQNTDLTQQQQDEYRKQVQGIFDNTVQICRYLISLDPENERNWLQLADVVYRYSQMVTDKTAREELLAQTEGIYKEAMKALPNSSQLATAYGTFLAKVGRGDQATDMLEALAKEAQGQEKIDAKVQLGNMYYQQGNNKEASRIFNEILQEDQNNLSASVFLAEIFAKQGDMNNAIERYKHVCQISDNVTLKGRCVELLLKNNRVDEAQEIVNEMRQSYPDSIVTLLTQGQLELFKTNYVASAAIADQVLSKNAMNRPAYLMKGAALFYDRQYEKALDCFQEMRSQFPNDKDQARMQLSDIYWAMGRYNDAISELQAELHDDPKNLECRKKLTRRLENQKRWNELDVMNKESLELYPQDVDLHLAVAYAAIEHGNQYQKDGESKLAQQQYQQALSWMEEGWSFCENSKVVNLNMLDGYLEVLFKTNQYEKALTLTEKYASDKSAPSMIMFRRAEALSHLKKTNEAMDVFEQILNTVEEDPAKTNAIISNAYRIGTSDELITWAENKLQQRPDWTVMRRLKTEMYVRKGEYARAISELETVREQAGAVETPQIEFRMAMIYEASGDKEKANEHYRKVLKDQPDNATVLNNFAYNLLLGDQNIDEAMTMAQRAYELSFRDADVMDTYALLLIKKSEFIRAEEILRRAIQFKVNDDKTVQPELEFHLAQALHGQGRVPAARQILTDLSRRLTDNTQQVADEKLLQDIHKLLEKMNSSN